MSLLSIASDASTSHAKLSLGLAGTPEDMREVQRLRYKVFIEAMGLSALANPQGLDQDEFDAFCAHLIVRDMKTLKVVGTYWILSPQAARKCGRFYFEQEFDLGRLGHYLRRARVGPGFPLRRPVPVAVDRQDGSAICPSLLQGRRST